MASEITIPKSAAYHGTLTKWFKGPGESVRKGEVLFEVTSEIGAERFPAMASGVVRSILRREGEEVAGGNVLGQIVGDATQDMNSAEDAAHDAGESLTEPVDEAEFPEVSFDELLAAVGPFDLTRATAELQTFYVRETADRFDLRKLKAGSPKAAFHRRRKVIRAMPKARVLANAHGIGLSDMIGCGVRGCITKRDVTRFIEQRRIFEKQQKEKRDADFSEQLASMNNAEPIETPELAPIDETIFEESPDSIPNGESDTPLSDESPNGTSAHASETDAQDQSGKGDKRVKMSHLAKNIAKKRQIALEDRVSGSGAHGRILKSDLAARVTEASAADSPAAPDANTPVSDQNTPSAYALDPEATFKGADTLRLEERMILNDYLVSDMTSELAAGGYRYHDFAQDTEVAVLSGDIDITFLKKYRKNTSKAFESETGRHMASSDLWLAAMAKAFVDVSTKKDDVGIALTLKNNDQLVTPVLAHAETMTLKDIVESRLNFIDGVKCNRFDKKVYQGADMAYINLSPFGIDALALPLFSSGTPMLTTGAPKDKAYGLTKKTVVTLALTVLPDMIPFGKAFTRRLSVYIAEPDLIFKS
ncbi:MAG: E3 binding domain-containing protein [Eubacteriaceae bacterium]|nr:E3 binding domain-containing protein [Eubacteriaceae bacterium]